MHQRLLYTGEKPTRLIYASVTTLTTINNTFKAVSHSHPNTEIIYVSEGEGYIVTHEQKIKLLKGDLAVISSLSDHREENAYGKEFTFYAVGVRDFYVPQNKDGITTCSPRISDSKTLLNCFKGSFEELKRDDTFYEDVVSLYIDLICTLTSRYTGATRGVSELQGTTLVESAKRFIDGRFYANIKAEEMADAMSVSYSTLIHTFKRETGKTITEYKLQKQIEEAKSLLSLTDMSINQIALNVGFSTNTYFSKIFKRKTGLMPKEYRNAKKDKESIL